MILSYKSFPFHEKCYNTRSWPSETPESASYFMRAGSCFANINQHHHNICVGPTVQCSAVYSTLIVWETSPHLLRLHHYTVNSPVRIKSIPQVSRSRSNNTFHSRQQHTRSLRRYRCHHCSKSIRSSGRPSWSRDCNRRYRSICEQYKH